LTLWFEGCDLNLIQEVNRANSRESVGARKR
jgi:hypothetical protein